MSEPLTRADDFKTRIRQSLETDTGAFASVHLSPHQCLYLLGDKAECVYFIDSGLVKLLTVSPDGKEGVLAIYTAGDTFGESPLTGCRARRETVMAMKETALKRIPSTSFLGHLNRNLLLESFVQYLINRVDDQQQIIGNLITLDCEHRLAEILLSLAHKLGRPNPIRTHIEQKITHEELSQMVGTTRSRITEFMLKFRGLGLIEMSPEHFLIVEERKLTEYLGGAA